MLVFMGVGGEQNLVIGVCLDEFDVCCLLVVWDIQVEVFISMMMIVDEDWGLVIWNKV